MNIIKSAILFKLFLLLSPLLFAQESGKISGSISTENKNVFPAVTISLFRLKDSSMVKLATTDKNGIYIFENMAIGKYIVFVTAVGYKKSRSGIIAITPEQPVIEVPAINLTMLSKELSSVTVTTRRPLIEQRVDRTIVNVDAAITNIGSSALEVLEKSPGVSVDREGNIGLKGKEGVLVLVDDRPVQLAGTDLANYLRGLNASQLDQVEIMTNPPARYDAEGNAGVINIKTKKNSTMGYNGAINIGYSQGRYPKTNKGFNFNFREKKINLFANIGYNYRKGFETQTIERNIHGNSNEPGNYFEQYIDKTTGGNAFNGKAGIDFFINKKTTLGVMINGTANGFTQRNQTTTNIFSISKEIESVTNAGVSNKNKLRNVGGNLNFRRILNGKGREITADIDYVHSNTNVNQYMVNAYPFTAVGIIPKADTLLGYIPQEIRVYSGRIDYVHPLKKNARFEAGIKAGIVRTDNNINYDSIQYGHIVHDDNRSNRFIYEENINAAYVNMLKPINKKLSMQLGLRLENTNASGRQLTSNENSNRHYLQLFPTAYLQYKADEKNNFVASYGRRTRRPNYQSLNPFTSFIDRYTYNRGNPALKPAYSNNYELTYGHRNLFSATINYSSTSNIISTVIKQNGREAISSPENIASLRQLGITLNANNNFTKRWASNINVNVYRSNYKTVVSGMMVNKSATSCVVMITQQFKITKSLTTELSGRYRSGWLEGIIKARATGFVWAGLSQQIMKNRGVIRLTVRDIFYTQKFKAVGKYSNVDFTMQEISDSRVLVLGFTYQFNKGKKLSAIKRTEGSAGEEQDRIGGQ
ncbi:MAG: TonB-dependent receptor [Ferruginibacter sp.]